MAYHNAVTDQLSLFVYSDGISVCIRSKTGSLKYFRALDQAIGHDLKAVLSASIFAKSQIIHCNVPFVLCPQALDSNEQALHYGMSHPATDELVTESLTEDISMVYKAHSLGDLDDLLVNPRHFSDVGLLHQYKGGLSRSNAVYFSLLHDQLLIRIYSASHLLMINRFPASSEDELFYFVMFAVEQLKLDVQALHFEYTGDVAHYTALKAMFQNYLPMLLHLPALTMDLSQLEEKEQLEWSSDWWPSIALQCV